MHNAGLSLVSVHFQLRNGKTYTLLHLDDEVLLNILGKVFRRRLGEGLLQICRLMFRRLLRPLLTFLVCSLCFLRQEPMSLGVMRSMSVFHDVLGQTLVSPTVLGCSVGWNIAELHLIKANRLAILVVVRRTVSVERTLAYLGSSSLVLLREGPIGKLVGGVHHRGKAHAWRTTSSVVKLVTGQFSLTVFAGAFDIKVFVFNV